LLVETDLGPRYHLVIVVDAEPAERVRRLVAARGLSDAEARQRIAAQADPAQRVAAADVWIDNNASLADLATAVDRVWTQRLSPYAANLRAGVPAPRPDYAALVPHRADWAAEVGRVMARIGTVPGPRRVDHVGSTAVPGLAAQDVIDIQVVVDDLAAAARLARDLTDSAGLIRMPGEWWDDDPAANRRDGKVFLRNADPCRAVNCHVRVEGSPAWREALLLRDWLRARPDAVREYTELEHRLAAQPPENMDAYADAKSPWIRWSLERAGRWAQSTGWSPG
jgi:dephospho-CoA kinase